MRAICLAMLVLAFVAVSLLAIVGSTNGENSAIVLNPHTGASTVRGHQLGRLAKTQRSQGHQRLWAGATDGPSRLPTPSNCQHQCGLPDYYGSPHHLQVDYMTISMAVIAFLGASVALPLIRHWHTPRHIPKMMMLSLSVDPRDEVEPTEEQEKMMYAHRYKAAPQERETLNSALDFLGFDEMDEEEFMEMKQEEAEKRNRQLTRIEYIPPPTPKPQQISDEPTVFSDEYFDELDKASEEFEKQLAEKKVKENTETFTQQVNRVTSRPEAAWIDEDDDEDDSGNEEEEEERNVEKGRLDENFDPDTFQAECVTMTIGELESRIGLLRQQLMKWKDEFFLKYSRDPNKVDVEASDISSVFQKHQIAAQWLTLKRRHRQGDTGAAKDETDEEEEEEEEYRPPKGRFASIRGREEMALRKLAVQTEQQCAEMPAELLFRFKRQLEHDIVTYKKEIFTEEFAMKGNAHDLPMLRLYIQYGIVKHWLAQKSDVSLESPEEQAKTEKIHNEAKEMEEQCRRMTIRELEHRQKLLREEILLWKRQFTDIHGRSPVEEDVFTLGMDSSFTEYGVTSMVLEQKLQEEN